MTKFTVLCYLLAHGPSSPIEVARGNEAKAWTLIDVMVDMTIAPALLGKMPQIVYQPLTGRFELAPGTDRIQLHEDCRKGG